ncbi:hypothetical protein P22_0851 [Propionispora sp. 2/2-37]|uniref:NAD(+) diphosphatase n=1 Tax=Propionispora sp. 2/2-37 TaxID=1677858 RepID=UPI0006BB69BF|nr:NAD(+) diphosphatase [Propionispora sp. 2/2-37]CUH94785.1 hypothetical protein P22_0851 [Propionispora sp. 2/2-37]
MILESDVNTVRDNAYWFIFCRDELLIKEEGGAVTIPLFNDLPSLTINAVNTHSIGSLNGKKCYIATAAKEILPEGFSFTKIKQLYGCVNSPWFWLAFRAFHLTGWLRNSQYCGRCGKPMNIYDKELAMHCPHCGFIMYPRLSPAIIVAVIRDGKLLLARNRMRPELYSVIAGFVEPGETLEECVRRELLEEVGMPVNNITYFGSQPWPFPDSLMVAFTAQAASDKITIDNQEIIEAGWFAADQLPNIPPSVSIGRKLIDWFTQNHKK